MKLRKTLRKVLAAVTAAVMAVGSVSISSFAAMDYSEFDNGYAYPTEMRGLSAFQITSDMGAGWNLGNSLESEYSETQWGNPVTTKSMIDAIADYGFTTLRVPVRWDDHYNSNYEIQSDYMDRVETVVNYGLANDMYVILNVHHNDIQGKVSTDTSVQTQVKQELSTIWTQIANRFKNYGDKLIFETINEPRCDEDWTGNDSYFACVNDYNEAARSAIRATGGNNADRLVMMPTYCASGDQAKINGWTKDANDDMIAASIHAYLPFDFAFNGEGHTDWLDSDVAELQSFFDRINSRFISQGIPVVIGEFGATNKNNASYRNQYADIYVSMARQFAQQDIPCVWWDNNCYNVGAENFGIFNRQSRTFTYSEIAQNLINAYNGDPECETAASGEQVFISQESSCAGWENIGQWDSSIITDMGDTDYIQLNYTAGNPKMVLTDGTYTGDKGWVMVDPDENSNGVAKWYKSSLKAAFGGSFDDLALFYMSCDNTGLTATKMALVFGAGGHTHSYNGTVTTTLAATATTDGRKVTQCSVSDCGACKITVIPATGTAVSAPTNVTAQAGNGKAVLSWDTVSGATKYAVYKYENNQYTAVNTNVTAASYTVTGLTNGTQYGFAVKAYGNGQWSKISSIAYVTPVDIVPTGVKIVAGNKQATISWDAVPNATKYSVYKYDNGSYSSICYDIYDTSYVITGMTNGTQYGFAVKAYINSEWSSPSTVVYVTPVDPVPTGLNAVAGDTQVTLSWTAVANAAKYAVYKYENGAYTALNTDFTATSFTATGLTNGTQYGFAVKAYVNGQWSSVSSVVYATPFSPVPTGVKAVAGNACATVTWTEVPTAAKYAVYKYENGAYTCLNSNIKTNSYTATGLANGTKYGFKVKAYVNGKWSGASAAAYATPAASSIVPENLKIANGDGKVQVTWDVVAGATKYAVYSWLDGVYTTETTTETSNSYTVTGLTNGTRYGFKVKAYVNGKWSAASSIIYARPSAKTAPGAIKAIAGNASAEVKWSGVIGATKYAVYKYENGVYTCIKSNITDTNYTVTGLTNGTKYGFKVKAYVDGAWSAASVIAYATPTA